MGKEIITFRAPEGTKQRLAKLAAQKTLQGDIYPPVTITALVLKAIEKMLKANHA